MKVRLQDIDFVHLCERYPEQAKALYTNEEFEI